MKLTIDDHFREIAQSILAEGRSDEEWSEIESDDMFQSGPYVGGYEATEAAFTFSYYDDDQKEYWFQLTLDEMKDVAEGKRTTIEARPATNFRDRLLNS
ncbi:MAG TPA: hypothetical protein VGQ19_19155 [Burkholderiales bacterium]|nr:hypothetical protein [Burkholderiales bacterium]